MIQMKSKLAHLGLGLCTSEASAIITCVILAAVLIWQPFIVSAGTTAPDATSRVTGVLPSSVPAASRHDLGPSFIASNTVVAPYAAVRPVLDGNLNDWQDINVAQLNKDNASAIVGIVPSYADLSATLRVTWTFNTLYFAGIVVDEVLIGNDSSSVWNDDCIELSMASAGRSHQFTLGVDGRKVDQGMVIVAATMVTRTIPGGWSFEAAIPSALLGGDLQGDQELPFTWALWDDDQDHSGPAQTHMFWQSDNTYSYRPTWGILRLSAPPTPTPTRTSFPTPPTPTATRTPMITREPCRVYLPLLVRQWPAIPVPPVLDRIVAPEDTSSYAVTWQRVPNAATYLLEQSTSSTFDRPILVFSGPATTMNMPSQGIATYYYRVKARNEWRDSNWSNVQAVETHWEHEPNEQKEDANGPIDAGLHYYGVLAGAADEKDYFYFDLTSPQNVELWLANMDSGQDFDLVLRDASLTMVGYSGKAGNSDEHIPSTLLSTGRYYVQIQRITGDSSQPYRLTLQYR